MSEVAIRSVNSRLEHKAFIQPPHAVFANDPAWIAPLNTERSQHISPRHNPLFEHGRAKLFLAFRDDRPVGRISAQLDDLRLARYQDATGMFGFLDGSDDREDFSALFAAAEIKKLGQDLKMRVEEHHITVASYQGESCAMAVTLPDINRAARDLNGKLLPCGWAELLSRLKFSAPEAVHLPLMGVRKKFHGTPIGSALAMVVIDALRTYHVNRSTQHAELSWIPEYNGPMRRMTEAIGGTAYKTYRIFERNFA